MVLMRGYRLYFMDRFSGHIEHRREFEAESDAAAIAIAEGWFADQPMELWLNSHKLKRWEPSSAGRSEMVRAEGEQKDDRDRNADQPKQDGTHLTIS
jgi:hypothetical protein